jgi:6-phosphogluconolactonase
MDNPREHRLYIGTYTRSGSRGIYLIRLDAATGALSPPELAAETGNPTFLALSPDRRILYAVRSSPQAVVAYRIGDGGRLTPLSPPATAEATGPCHVAVDRTGRLILATNYHTAEIVVLDGRPDQLRPGLVAPSAVEGLNLIRHQGHGTHPQRQASAHPHSAAFSPDNRFALVCDLGLDRVFSYAVDPSRAEVAAARPLSTPLGPGSGPRHLAFGPGGRSVYVISELANTITVFNYEPAAGALLTRQVVSTLPPGHAGESFAAEVSLHPAGAFLYGSNRGHDSLAAFAVDPSTGFLSPAGWTPCGGKGPRHFVFSPDGRWLVCAHQGSDSIVSFAVGDAGARLTPTGSRVSVPTPVCVLFAP